ncbi:hypothetical protein UFOVP1344_21 [uncultured Caudovirales phage]|uniref:Uncharacterized protein n=1 Tax=uncultured Caudovirales phage TaxID=2100421 RepID=A0A6J5RRI4_9CAUD|nr:hypothetical protein UFOVP1005_21 [uncultured Caudovirales phage]CAB4199980.1 hypothetical protein UFOVP1344_21 [uncultured Caudovirales phage]CAB4218255.1 hypothetical protein UFOVP1602_19 [uncultured Caudovirales phage]
MMVYVPVMYGLMVHNVEDSKSAEQSARQLILDLAEEVWDETFEHDGKALDLVSFDWLNGMFSDLIVEEVPDGTEEDTQGGDSESSGDVRTEAGEV